MSAEYLREGIAGKHSTLAGTASCDDKNQLRIQYTKQEYRSG